MCESGCRRCSTLGVVQCTVCRALMVEVMVAVLSCLPPLSVSLSLCPGQSPASNTQPRSLQQHNLTAQMWTQPLPPRSDGL